MTTKEIIYVITTGKRQPKWWNFLMSALLYPLLLLFLFPYPLFQYKTCHRNITVYSTLPIDPAIKTVLDSSYSLLETSEIYEPALNHTVFLLESFSYAKFFGLNRYKAFGWNYYYLNKIFIVKPDIANNTCSRNDSTYNERPLSEVITHEIVHSLQKENLGLITMTISPTWKIEGYAQYVSNPEKFNLADVQHNIQNVRYDKSFPGNYIRYKIAVQYLFDNKKYTFEKLTESTLDLKDVIEEIERL